MLGGNKFSIALLALVACGAARPSPEPRAAAPSSKYACAKDHPDTPGDSDGDGVSDAIDACPCRPGASMPDDDARVRGCPWDSAPRPHPTSEPISIALVRYAVSITPPASWTVERQGDAIIVRAPSGKSGLVFWAADDPTQAPTALHLAEETFHLTFPFAIGKRWNTASGLGFMRDDETATTNDGAHATTIFLAGTSPRVPGSEVAVLGVAVEGDGTAKADLDGALDSVRLVDER